METQEILKQCTIEGNILKLPEGQLERNQYLEVKKKLELIEGKWKGGKTAGFVFEQDPTELLNQISNGGDRNLKKEFQFFETPEALADRLVSYANLQEDDLILEPSAGRGAIIKAINRFFPDKVVDCYELMELNHSFLDKIPNANLIGNDFLKFNVTNKYDKIIANPPFRNNQDIAHIRKMYSCLKEGGRLVTIASKHWQTSQNKKETEFREWLEMNNVTPIDIEAGEFKESGTIISTCIIRLDKPKGEVKTMKMYIESKNGHDTVEVPKGEEQQAVENQLKDDKWVTLEKKDGSSEILTKKDMTEDEDSEDNDDEGVEEEDEELSKEDKELSGWKNTFKKADKKPVTTPVSNPVSKPSTPKEEWKSKFEDVESAVAVHKAKGG